MGPSQNVALGATDTHEGALDVAPEIAQIREIWALRERWWICYERRHLFKCDCGVHSVDCMHMGAIFCLLAKNC
jgi:hypothetical protein